MKESLISVIVPVYKVENYLNKCVQSIVNQTYQNLEIILVDDGSPDKCPQMCDEWKIRDSRIKVVHKSNGGASSARNAGLEIATGNYIGFVDSDDYIDRTMFETLHDMLLGSSVKVSCCSIFRLTSSGTLMKVNNVTDKKSWDVAGAVNAVFYGQADTSMCNKLFNREIFEDLRFPEGESNEEFTLLIPALVKSGGIICTGEALYYYREREGSVTTSLCMQDSSSGLVHKNLGVISKQLELFSLPCVVGYRYFAACSAFSCALAMEKKYPQLSVKMREDYGIYRKVMWKYSAYYLFSKFAARKDKALFCMVLTKLLRPLYRVFYKEHL